MAAFLHKGIHNAKNSFRGNVRRAGDVAGTCAVADVWVEHWDSENIDVYATDDTITSKLGWSYKIVDMWYY